MHEHQKQHGEKGCTNRGIVCDVTNCHYHDENHRCTADQIQVGPSFAISSADTICTTFKNK